MDGEGFSDRVGASGGSSTLLSGRTFRLCGDALDPRESGSLVAFALHRIEWRLARICDLVSTRNSDSPQAGRAMQNPHRSAFNFNGSSIKRRVGKPAAPKSNYVNNCTPASGKLNAA